MLMLRVAVLASLLNNALALVLEERDCAANNCLRAVRATNVASHTKSASSDCSSYLAGSTTTVTVIPSGIPTAPFTTTKTVKLTKTVKTVATTTTLTDYQDQFTLVVSTSIIPAILPRATAKSIPAYASACTLQNDYASACSCFGILPPFTKTVTYSEPIVTVDITTTIRKTLTKTIQAHTLVTLTITHHATVTAPADSFYLQGKGSQLDGYFVSTLYDTDTLYSVELFTSETNGFVTPSYFELRNGHIRDTESGFVAASTGPDDYNYLSFQPINNVPKSALLVCTITGGLINCQTGSGLDTFVACLDESGEEFPPSMFFFAAGDALPFDCFPLKFKEIPVV